MPDPCDTPVPHRLPVPGRPPVPNRDREGAQGAERAGPLPDGRGSECGRDYESGDPGAPNRDRKGAPPRCQTGDGPLAYFITFHTYGTWLHGDERGSMDRQHNEPGTPCLPPNEQRRRREEAALQHAPVTLSARARDVVERTILEVAEHHGWTVHTQAARSNHVHVIVSAPDRPEPVMNAFKSWSTRRLVEAGCLRPKTRAWVRHGSTVYLWKPVELCAAVKYVAYGQGPDQ